MKLTHSYQTLPALFYAPALPDQAPAPEMVVFNHDLAQTLGIDDSAPIADWCSGRALPPDAKPIAQAYAGHQFGQLNRLGDGRAVLLGEIQTPNGLVDMQLKGSGRTPFSRHGDGKANLAPMLREYLLSEALFALGIPTTRSLAVVKTGEAVRRKQHRQGAVLTRIASSHLRVGTFVFASIEAQRTGNLSLLQQLLDYTLARHYPDWQTADNPALALLERVIARQAQLMAQWQGVGFIHGVMNTDNVTISGETIDYGPCAFMDTYAEHTVFSSIDVQGRYAFGNQPPMMAWNMARFAESLLPLIDSDDEKAVALATQQVAQFEPEYRRYWQEQLCAKLGVPVTFASVAEELLPLLYERQLDYTNTFVALTQLAAGEPADLPTDAVFSGWLNAWQSQLHHDSVSQMQTHNPVVIPRNHQVEAALQGAENGDLTAFYALHQVLQQPYDWQQLEALTDYRRPASAEWTRQYQTFCGT
ncbi:MAG: hypothetical protein CR974_02395 [Gammaproteobacteria bacterium]|nr:MAG: hypothetical protein CR974_02395 [Gammaproteobacteria bacterium]